MKYEVRQKDQEGCGVTSPHFTYPACLCARPKHDEGEHQCRDGHVWIGRGSRTLVGGGGAGYDEAEEE